MGSAFSANDMDPARAWPQRRLWLPEGEHPVLGGGPAGPQLLDGKRPQSKVEHFWLCGSCIKTMTLAFDPGKGVVIVPHGTPMRRAAAG